LVTITKQQWKGKFFLGTKEVKTITPYLDDAVNIGNPFTLKQNEGKSFQGSIILGNGFIIEPNLAEAIIAKDPKNKDVLFPYLIGDDLNNNPDQFPSRWVINFFDWTIEKAKSYPDCYEIIEHLVKPERQRWAVDKDGIEIFGTYALGKPLPEKWWIYCRQRPALYNKISNLKRILIVPSVVKNFIIDFAPNNFVYSHSSFVLTLSSYFNFVLLANTFHENWAWKNCSTMGAGLRYTSSTAFETFPFPVSLDQSKIEQLESIGENYQKYRTRLITSIQLGLTKTYNQFHNNAITAQSINYKEKQVASLQKHLEKTANTISFDEAIKGILKLRELHVQMDKAVLDAYGWNDISLKHDFYEVDYLPENDRVRFTIHPDARKEVLKRLLELNHKIHEEEVAAGLFDKKPSAKSKKKKDITPEQNQ